MYHATYTDRIPPRHQFPSFSTYYDTVRKNSNVKLPLYNITPANNQIPSINRVNNIISPQEVTMEIPFWISNPNVLFTSTEIIPGPNMSMEERMNAMTRVVIVIAAIMYSIQFPAWWLFLAISLIVIVVIWYSMVKQKPVERHYLRQPKNNNRIITPIDAQNNEYRRPINKPSFKLVPRR
jgi:hypothetical protein